MNNLPPITTGMELVNLAVGQVHKGKDLMICNHGGEGTGKSTTAQNFIRVLEKRLGVKSTRIFNFDQLLAVFGKCLKGQIYELDEAINIFHNQDWATWEAKALTKIIRQMRIMKSLWILNVPDFEGLHPYLRDYRIPIRLYHPPEWTKEGLGNGPAKILVKSERFGYKAQQVECRWQDVGDFHSHCMDEDPEWEAYEESKVENFKGLVKALVDRHEAEKAKEERKNHKKRPAAKNRPAPPIATQ